MATNRVKSWDATTAANNVSANIGYSWDEGMAPSVVNDSARQTLADVRYEWSESSLSAAGTVALGAATGFVHISGSASVSSFDTISAGIRRRVMFENNGAILVHDGTKFILPGAANITATAGDCAEFVSEGSGNWRCTSYTGAGIAATQANQEAGTETIRPVTPAKQQFHPSAAKGWVRANFDGTSTNSYNVSSITDVGSGVVGVNFSTAFSASTAITAVATTFQDNSGGASSYIAQVHSTNLSASRVDVATIRGSDFATTDATSVFVVAFGDQ